MSIGLSWFPAQVMIAISEPVTLHVDPLRIRLRCRLVAALVVTASLETLAERGARLSSRGSRVCHMAQGPSFR
jgi:hypothetical protein